MKTLDPFKFDYDLCRKELETFRDLLAKNVDLSEKHQILPLFRESRQLCSLFAIFNTWIVTADRFAKEFDFFGDFACDVAVGDWAQGEYCFVEFEDARKNSIFEKNGVKVTREWGKRFDHGYSQIVDWAYKLSGMHLDQANLARFGRFDINYETVLVIGRDAHQDPAELHRLKWRSRHVSIGNRTVHCLTFDELLSQFDARMASFAAVESFGRAQAQAATTPNSPSATAGSASV